MTDLELDAEIERRPEGGWRVRVPVRREEVSVARKIYVVEEVEIRREYEDVELEATQRIDTRSRPTTAS